MANKSNVDIPFISTALNMISGFGAQTAEKANIKARNTVNAASTYASNLMRSANNELVSKRNSLARFVQTENNSRLMKQTGRELEAASINYRRSRDAATRGDFESQIGFAEQAGAQAAMAGASGLVGGVADVVASTTALRASRINQATSTAFKQSDWDAVQRQRDILAAGLNSLDQSQIIDDLDYSVDTYIAQKSTGSWLGGVLGTTTQQGLQAGANYIGGFFNTPSYSAFTDMAGTIGSGSSGRTRTITGGR